MPMKKEREDYIFQAAPWKWYEMIIYPEKKN